MRAQTLTIGFVLFGVLAASSFVLWSRRARARAARHARAARYRERLVRRRAARRQHCRRLLAHTHRAQARSGQHAERPGSRPCRDRASRCPRRPQEALHVLGASPDASIDVIKKIVDGLRQSWHPDLARSDDDRLYREQRIKQINVAWDILSGRRSAA